MMKRTYVPAYRLLLSLGNKQFIIYSLLWSPCNRLGIHLSVPPWSCLCCWRYCWSIHYAYPPLKLRNVFDSFPPYSPYPPPLASRCNYLPPPWWRHLVGCSSGYYLTSAIHFITSFWFRSLVLSGPPGTKQGICRTQKLRQCAMYKLKGQSLNFANRPKIQNKGLVRLAGLSSWSV